jgi:hypothetical protein
VGAANTERHTVMRDPETSRLLDAVRSTVAEARRGGATVRSCIWDATAAAVDVAPGRPSREARAIADAACRAVEPPTARANPTPRPKVPLLARVLFAAANGIARRAAS